MALKYPKEQLKKIHTSLPDPLKEALGSVEIQDEIDEICRQNGITNAATIDKVYDLVMDIFMGLVLLPDFEKELQSILGPKKTVLREMAHQINRVVLYPLKLEVEQLHRTGGKKEADSGNPPRHSDTTDDYMVQTDSEQSPEQQESEEEDIFPEDFTEDEEGAEEEPKPKKQDSYRESLE